MWRSLSLKKRTVAGKIRAWQRPLRSVKSAYHEFQADWLYVGANDWCSKYQTVGEDENFGKRAMNLVKNLRSRMWAFCEKKHKKTTTYLKISDSWALQTSVINALKLYDKCLKTVKVELWIQNIRWKGWSWRFCHEVRFFKRHRGEITFICLLVKYLLMLSDA